MRKHAILADTLRAILADGAWHAFTLLFQQTAQLIDPREAARYYTRAQTIRRKSSRIEQEDAADLLHASLEERLAVGRRRIIHMCLSSFHCEHRGSTGKTEYRLPPASIPSSTPKQNQPSAARRRKPRTTSHTKPLPQGKTAVTQAIADVLSDGAWHPAQELLEQVGPLVDDETARKVFLAYRPQHQRQEAERLADTRPARSLATGRMRKIQSTINNWKKDGHFVETRGRYGHTEYRLCHS